MHFGPHMTTQHLHHEPAFLGRSTDVHTKAETYLELLGRVLLSVVFVSVTPEHFSGEAIRYAASQGVPFAEFLVPASGILALIGGLSVLTGYKAKAGAWLLIAFLVPVTMMMHRFWSVPDPQQAMLQKAMFMKNLGLLGGALLVAYFGAGPASFDRFAERLRERN